MTKFAETWNNERLGLDKPDPDKALDVMPQDVTKKLRDEKKLIAEALASRRMTMDDIIDAVTDVAKESEGADRFRALKMLASMDSGTAVLPDPMSSEEAITRLARLMKIPGRDIAVLAFQRAFPHARKRDQKPEITDDMIPEEWQRKLPRIKSLKALYRAFPAIKRSGMPVGYPKGRGLLVQTEWVQRKAMQILREMLRDQANEAEAAAKAVTTTEPATDGPANES